MPMNPMQGITPAAQTERIWFRSLVQILIIFIVASVCTIIIIWVHGLPISLGGDGFMSAIGIIWAIFLLCAMLIGHFMKQKVEEIRKLWDVADEKR